MPVTFSNDRWPLHEPRFMRPVARPSEVSPLDPFGAKLVAELARVGWDVPGIEVRFRTYGDGANLMRVVSSVRGDTPQGPFLVRYGNPQGEMLGTWNVTTGVSDIVVPPGIEAQYFSDGSGPTYYVYVGGAWEGRGARDFMDGNKTNAKLNGERRTYVTWSGDGQGAKAKVKWRRDCLDREYGPEGEEPEILDGARVIAIAKDVIDGVVERLAALPSAPGHDDVTASGDANLRRLAAVERIPVPASMSPLYAWVEANDVAKFVRGENRTVVPGSGWRLASLGAKDGKGPLPDRARDGFSFASHDPSKRAGQVVYGAREGSVPVEVNLRFLNDVYVVDDAAFRKAVDEKRELAESEGRGSITDAELDAAVCATARTMVPYAEYDGRFEDPTVIIGRELGADEARVVRGPIELRVGDEKVHVNLTDEATGNEFVLHTERDFVPRVREGGMFRPRTGRDTATSRAGDFAFILGLPRCPRDFREMSESALTSAP